MLGFSAFAAALCAIGLTMQNANAATAPSSSSTVTVKGKSASATLSIATHYTSTKSTEARFATTSVIIPRVIGNSYHDLRTQHHQQRSKHKKKATQIKNASGDSRSESGTISWTAFPGISTPSDSTMKLRILYSSGVVTYTATETVNVIEVAKPSGTAPVDHRRTFRIKTKVYYGDSRFDDLTIQNPTDPNVASAPTLSRNITNAAKFYFDGSTSSLALCCAKSNTTSGLVMVRDHDYDAYGTALLGKEVGTARIGWECCDHSPPHPDNLAGRNETIVWKNDRFGSWLVCERPVSGVYELKWWDVISNRGIDQNACAKVQLQGVNFGNETHADC